MAENVGRPSIETMNFRVWAWIRRRDFLGRHPRVLGGHLHLIRPMELFWFLAGLTVKSLAIRDPA